MGIDKRPDKKFGQGSTGAPAAAGGQRRKQVTGSLARSRVGRAGSLHGVRLGVCPGVGQEGWLRWSAHPFGGVECRGHVRYPVFAPGSSEVAVRFLVFFYLAVQNMPQLPMHTVLFSPL